MAVSEETPQRPVIFQRRPLADVLDLAADRIDAALDGDDRALRAEVLMITMLLRVAAGDVRDGRAVL